MPLVITYDTETTGLPDWKAPSGGDNQPHIVQLGAVVADSETREEVASLDLIIKPDGWEIPQETIDVHGITNERALAEGVPEAEALEQFLELRADHLRIAHNKTFDQRIIRIATKRFSAEDVIEKWADKESHLCTMQMAKPIMELPPKGRYGYKSPKLEEAYEFFTGQKLEGAHNAMVDARACLAVYWGLLDHQNGKDDTATKLAELLAKRSELVRGLQYADGGAYYQDREKIDRLTDEIEQLRKSQ